MREMKGSSHPAESSLGKKHDITVTDITNSFLLLFESTKAFHRHY